jgi:hypothetical protein
VAEGTIRGFSDISHGGRDEAGNLPVNKIIDPPPLTTKKASGPISRILRVGLQTNKLLGINRQ